MTAYKTRWAPLVVVGLVSGLAQVAAGVTMYLAGVYFASWSALVSLGVLTVCLVAGTAWHRRNVLDGRTTYWIALGVGVSIAVLTGLTYVAYNFVSVTFVYPHFLDDMILAQFSMSRGMDMNAAQAAQLMERLRTEMTLGMIVRTNFAGFVMFGTALSALIAVALRGSRQPLPGGVETVVEAQ